MRLSKEDVLNIAILNVLVRTLDVHQATIIGKPWVSHRYKMLFNNFLKAGKLFNSNIIEHKGADKELLETLDDDTDDFMNIMYAYMSTIDKKEEFRDHIFKFVKEHNTKNDE